MFCWLTTRCTCMSTWQCVLSFSHWCVCSCTWKTPCSPHRSWRWSESRWLCHHTHHRSGAHSYQTHQGPEWTYSQPWAPSLNREEIEKEKAVGWDRLQVILLVHSLKNVLNLLHFDLFCVALTFLCIEHCYFIMQSIFSVQWLFQLSSVLISQVEHISCHLSACRPNSVPSCRRVSSLELNSTSVFLSCGKELEPYGWSGKTLVPLQNVGSGLHLIT